jgi:glucosyl-dolichyl phosphate glucuronosyltransferase
VTTFAPGDGQPGIDGDAVTVVIACHTEKRWRSLLEAIRSAVEQRPAPAAVVVSVDHNPALSERLRASFPGITVVDNDGAPGASGARNAGARVASTPFVAFLDDDAIARPGWLAELLRPLEDASVVGTGGAVAPLWTTRRPPWFPDEFAWVIGASYTGLPEEPAEIRNVWSENMAVRRAAFEAVGGFRAGFGKLGNRSRPEDTDLCIRMARNGRWMYAPSAVVDHLVPADRETFSFFLARSFAEGRGKIEMAGQLAGERSLGAEGSFVTQTVPHGILSCLRSSAEERALGPLLRALALIIGTAAAGAGATVAIGSRLLGGRARAAGSPEP